MKAEHEYQNAVKKAAKAAEAYTNDRKQKQGAYLEMLKREWELFEEDEKTKLESKLSEEERRLEKETAQSKKRLRARQMERAHLISERLKGEVLSWQSPKWKSSS